MASGEQPEGRNTTELQEESDWKAEKARAEKTKKKQREKEARKKAAMHRLSHRNRYYLGIYWRATYATIKAITVARGLFGFTDHLPVRLLLRDCRAVRRRRRRRHRCRRPRARYPPESDAPAASSRARSCVSCYDFEALIVHETGHALASTTPTRRGTAT